ncbi:MAG: hypothetical protein H2046_02600 [Rhizobiales bacterium]|nr:hypothetical protein [Hyphomicrobiales bacterium]
MIWLRGRARSDGTGWARYVFPWRRASQSTADAETKPSAKRPKEILMLKFIGGTIGAIFLIGLIVVVLLLMLIF